MSKNKKTGKERVTSISLDDNLYKAVKHLAVEERKSLKDIVTESISEYLQKRGIQQTTE
jgi:Ribbon-helix-helix protein, copG family.